LQKAILSRIGLEIDVVCNGAEAIEALTKADHAMVLMDCAMPVMDGLEATKRIRDGSAKARNPSITIIAITADAFRANRAACKNAGMNDFISKPVSVPGMQEVVQRWILGNPPTSNG